MSPAGGCPSWQAMVSVRTSIVPPGPCPPLADTPGTSPAATAPQVTASIHDFAGSLGCPRSGQSRLLRLRVQFRRRISERRPAGTGDIAASAGRLASFVTRVLAATGAAKADIVGHSQGGMMPRYYLKFLGGAAKVDKLVGIAPSNHGTTLSGLTSLGQTLGLLGPVNSVLSTTCMACVEQEVGSSFLTKLNSGGDTVSGVQYTVIESTGDEVVTPYTSAFLSGPNVTDITVNNQCSSDMSDHLE